MRYTTRSFRIAVANKGPIQINVEYCLARVLLTFFAALPLGPAMRLGSLLARLGSLFPHLRRNAELNLRLAFPDLSAVERQKLLRGCFESLGRLLALFSHFNSSNRAKLESLMETEGLEHLVAAKKRGRGVILFTGHIGAWELTSFGLSMLGHPLSFLVRRMDNPKIEALIDRGRTQLGNRTIDKRSAAREMVQILRRGETLGILVDLNTLDREGIFVDFFGKPASTTFLVAKLALRTGADVVPIFAPWSCEQQRFMLKIDEPLRIEPANDEAADVLQLTQLITNVVEKYVRRYPEQWLWIHRRWKTRPPGEPDIYQDVR
jgi:Kdo2-lipid IVA lauroyltransferase/acyltransferase